MIIAAYFFSDEAEQLQGPYLSKEDAEEASRLYAKCVLQGDYSPEEAARYTELNRSASDLGNQKVLITTDRIERFLEVGINRYVRL